MSDFCYHLSVPIDDPKVYQKLKEGAKKHNVKGKLAPFVLELLTGLLNGEYVHIEPSTPQRPPSKRRIE
jgi:hypothetical protein